MYEGLINNLNKAADKWEKEHPIIGVGQLRVQDALRDAARALKEADSKLEQVTLERDAAVKDLAYFSDCRQCNSWETEENCKNCRPGHSGWEWRGVQKEE